MAEISTAINPATATEAATDVSTDGATGAPTVMTSEITTEITPFSDSRDGDSCPIIHLAESQVARDTPPCAMTIFGATGDLTQRKLMPALYDLAEQQLLPDEFVILGYGRRPQDLEQFRADLAAGVREFARLKWDDRVWQWLAERIFYQQGAYDEASSFAALDARLDELGRHFHTRGNRLYYMATPPGEFAPIIENLGQLREADRAHGRGPANPPGEPRGWWRLIIEKPFGSNLNSAHSLNELLGRCFNENEVFRIDHYLGKETVQNILALRFANAIFEPIWNNRYIDHVQIAVAEKVGVGRRGGYYETSGALRDMVVNHMFQLMTLVTMEAPVTLTANAIRDEKVQVLRALRMFPSKEEVLQNTVRGQYEGYKQEEGVAPDSRIETYVALKMHVDNWRWFGVPFYLRHGKSLPQRTTEIVVRWKDTPSVLFNQGGGRVKSNMLILRIQPDECFALRVNAKVPGSGNEIHDVRMEYEYAESLDGEPPEAYERLLHDALLGDSTLFTRRDEVEVAWSIVDSILNAWKDAPPPHAYEQGSWGPQAADELIARDDHRWHRPHKHDHIVHVHG